MSDAALKWLARAANSDYSKDQGDRFRGQLKAIASLPRMPEEPTPEILMAMQKAAGSPGSLIYIYRAIYAHLTRRDGDRA